MTKRKSLGLLGAGVLIGLFAGRSIDRSSTLPSESFSNESSQICQTQLDELRTKFSNLSQVDLAEYLQLKDMKARYEKADEIFGKIMTIFLADLGIRVAEGQLKLLKSQTGTYVTPSGGGTNERHQNESAQSQISPAARVPIPTTAKSDTAVEEVAPKPSEVNSEADLSDFFAKVALTEPTSAWRSAKALAHEHLELVNGTFDGEMRFDNPLPQQVKSRDRKLPWKIRFETHLKRKRGQDYYGRIEHVIWNEKGERISRTSSGGDSKVTNFRAYKDGSILIDAYGGDMIIQLYYFPRLREFNGVVYEKGSELGSEFVRIGTVRLQKDH